MQDVRTFPSWPPPRAPTAGGARDTGDDLQPWSPKMHPDRLFVEMLNAYRGSGGLARAPEVLTLFHRCHGPDTSMLARWIVHREVICFEWQSQSWLPLFQFDRLNLHPHLSLRPIFIDLSGIYNPWQMAVWFARPNQWLGNRSPVDALLFDLPAVVDTARTDRLVARGR